jgi:CDP-diacylglycerol--glycerol-3-phosphate 3-phosphatidyltransferase
MLSIAAAVATALGRFAIAAGLVIAAGLCDLFDGAVARATQRASPMGKLLDSTIGRFSDAALYAGAIVYFAVRGNLTFVVLGLLGLAAAQGVSYVRARAETLIEECRVGTWERPERMVALILGLVSGHITTALWILATFPYLTVVGRVLHTRRVLAADGSHSSWLGRLFFWGFPRTSTVYWLQAAVISAFCFLFEIPANDWLRQAH